MSLFTSVKSRLYLLAFVPLIVYFAATFILFQFHVRRLVVEDYRHHLSGVLDTEARLIDNWLEERRRDVNTLALALRGHLDTDEALRRRLESFLPYLDEFHTAGFAGPGGRVRVRTDLLGSDSVADRPFFRQALSGSGVVTRAVIDPATGIQTLICATAVRTKGEEPAGVLFAMVNLDDLHYLVQETVPESIVDSYLLDVTGTFLTLPNITSLFTDTDGSRLDPVLRINVDTAVFQAAAARRPIDGAYTNYAGRSVFGDYHWLNNGRWLLVGETPASRIHARYSGYTTLLIFVLFITAVLVVSVVIGLNRTIAAPLRALEREMQQVKKEGGSDLRPDWRVFRLAPVEIRSLAYSFHTMEEQLSENIQALQEATITDELTRLYNRRHLFEEGYRYVHMVRRTRTPLACLILDIDHFKEINDTYGHAAGDQVLREVSRQIRESIRDTDFPARYGGEEFVILAYQADRDQALQLGERLRERIAAQVHETEEARLQITVSIGVSLLHEQSRAARSRQNVKSMLDRLIRIADDALYAAKDAGRNRVAFGETVNG